LTKLFACECVLLEIALNSSQKKKGEYKKEKVKLEISTLAIGL
jgi:hypothetical protein